MSLNNKVAIVTGASSGIGAATAIVLAKQGASVVLVGRNEANLNSVASKCGKQAYAVKADISKDDEAATVINKTIYKYGKIDILVNNAGIAKYAAIMDKNTAQYFDEIMNTNLRAVVVLVNLAIPHLVKTKGNIVNVSSTAAKKTLLNLALYSVSKAGLNHFTRCAAQEFAEKGVRVNTVSPGPVETPILETSGTPLTWDQFKSMTALNKIAQPEEVGRLIAFLASDDAGSITGAEYIIDCGSLIK